VHFDRAAKMYIVVLHFDLPMLMAMVALSLFFFGGI
jgi:hypothetical protein